MQPNLNTPSLAAGPLTAADLVATSEVYPQADWPRALAAAVAANLTNPAMSGADPMAECLAEQCCCFARPSAAGSVIPCSTLARWWLSFKRWF